MSVIIAKDDLSSIFMWLKICIIWRTNYHQPCYLSPMPLSPSILNLLGKSSICNTIMVELDLPSKFLWNSIVKKPFQFLKNKFQRWKSIPFAPLVQNLWNKKCAHCRIKGFWVVPKPKKRAPRFERIPAWLHIQTYKQTHIIIYRY